MPKWWRSNYGYFFYGFLILVNVPALFNKKLDRGTLIFICLQMGVYLGGIIISLFHRMQKRTDESMQKLRDLDEELKRRIWQAETEARIRAQYAASQPKAPAAVSLPGSELEEL